MIHSLHIFNYFVKIINNKKYLKIISTKYILCIIYDFVDILHNEFSLTLLFSKLCSIFNDKKKLRARAIIFKYINKLIN